MPFTGYLQQRWRAGEHNAFRLWREIKCQGFTGEVDAVQRFVRAWRKTSAGKMPCPVTITEAAASVVPLRDANNNPISNVQALVSVVDNGATLDITGLATGMDPTQQYVSLFYDTASQDTTLNACLPTPGGSQQTFSQMLIGVWLPLGTSTRTLKASKFGPPASPVPLAYLAVNQSGTHAGGDSGGQAVEVEEVRIGRTRENHPQ